MSTQPFAVLLTGMVACKAGMDIDERKHGGRDSATDDSGDGSDSGDSAVDTADLACEEIAPLPVDESYLSGYTGAEDFAFDSEGYLVSIDQRGNLLAINQAGDEKVILPQATAFGAGTRFLPNGDIVFCDAEKGNLVRVDPENPTPVVVLSGLEYPNGLDVDLDGFVYVSEQNAGRVRRIDPDTGDYEIVASNLYNPNGVTFGPGYTTMYVGSFGAGVAWAVDRVGDGTWAEPRVYATTPEAPGVPPDWCETFGVGADCPPYGGYGLGECIEGQAGEPTCDAALDYAACDGLSDGDSCETTRFDAAIESHCSPASDGSGLFCPHTEAENIEACLGKAYGDTCDMGEKRGSCYDSDQSVLACLNTDDYYAAYQTDCATKAEGDACIIDDPVFPSVGLCGDGAAWGMAGLVCFPGGAAYSEHGGIDGINVDQCGNLYLTEYILGKVWRFDAEGAEAQLVTKLKSSWIPNMHWGNGVGGWELDTLYVMERDRSGVYALPVNIGGHGDAYVPGAE